MGVRLVFTLQFLVMPKYYTRVLYEDFELGFANSINPIIIVLGLIIIIPVINKYSTMKLMMWGMLISAISLCFMVLPIEWFLALPWIHTMSEAFVFVIFTQIIMFAFGELLFSPRFTEYVASVAPKDKVASYMALSALPMFIAKPINGFLSGLLVSIFCYEGIRAKIDTGNIDYGDSPQFMWAIYFVFALLSPLFIMAFKKWLTVNTGTTPTEADDEEAVSAAAKIESPEEQQAESIVNLIPENNSNN
jgi:dipeptide/tripeptide permease